MKLVVRKPMERIVVEALSTLDARMAEKRSAIIGPNQAIHELKFEEASRYLNNGTGTFPILDAEAEAKDLPVRAVAAAIVLKRDKMKAQLAQLESERQILQAAIRAATCPDDVSTALKGMAK